MIYHQNIITGWSDPCGGGVGWGGRGWNILSDKNLNFELVMMHQVHEPKAANQALLSSFIFIFLENEIVKIIA